MAYKLTQYIQGTKVWIIDADSRKDAWNRWHNNRDSLELDFEDYDTTDLIMEKYE